MHSRSLLLIIVPFLLFACQTPEPPPPPMAINPVGSANGNGLSDSPKFDQGDDIAEDEWSNGADMQNGAGSASGMNIAAYPVIYFAYDQASLSPQTEQVLQQVANRLQTETGYSIQIEGHCDERGTTEYNLALGDRRANSVREYLEAMGVAPSRLGTISYGEERPKAEGHSESEFAQNRRVEFKTQSLSH